MSQTATRISIQGSVDVTRTTRHVACKERFRQPMVNRNVCGYSASSGSHHGASNLPKDNTNG